MSRKFSKQFTDTLAKRSVRSNPLLSSYTSYGNTAQSDMERDHLPPLRDEHDEVETIKLNQFDVKSRVGRLVKSFERRAA